MSASNRKTRPIAVRLTEDDLSLVAEAAQELSRRSDGLRVSSSDVIRLGATRFARELVDPSQKKAA